MGQRFRNQAIATAEVMANEPVAHARLGRDRTDGEAAKPVARADPDRGVQKGDTTVASSRPRGGAF
jgi:hypothetical protein